MSVSRFLTIVFAGLLAVGCSSNSSEPPQPQAVQGPGQGTILEKSDGGTAYVFKFTEGGKEYECISDVELDEYNRPVDQQAWLTMCREAKAPIERVVLSADMLFQFAKYRIEDIRFEGRERLNELARDLVQDQDSIERISIVGHADRIGNAESNYTLSLNRAQSVADYLTRMGVSPQLMRVNAEGSGSPVSQCSEGLPRNQLIACLAPDRRVDVQIIRRQ